MLSTADLQANSDGVNGGEKSSAARVPSAVIVVTEQSMVVVGFDSGEVQCYPGFRPTTGGGDKMQVGAGFRIADGAPVTILKYLHR